MSGDKYLRRTVLKSSLVAAGLTGIGGTAAAATALAVSTNPATSESHDSVELWGSLDGMGGAADVDVTFEWRAQGSSSWTTTWAETLTTTGPVRHYVTGLSSGTTYEFRLTATASTGETATASTNTFTTDSSPTYKATTNAATDVSDTSAVLNGTLEELQDGSTAEVFFRWGPAGGPSGEFPANNTLPWDMTSPGEFSEEITGLDPDTDYEFWFVTDSDAGDFDRGEARFVRDGSAASALALSTEPAGTASDTSGTLVGSVTDLGGADSVDVAFEWRQVGASSWTTTSTQTRSSTGTFSVELTGLAEETEYEYRVIGTASNGDSDEGSLVSFFTTGDPLVRTDNPTNLEPTSVRLLGALESDGGADSVDVSFEWGPDGDFSNTVTEVSTSDSQLSYNSFFADLSGLEPSTTYNYRAVVDASDGESDTGSIVEFTTPEDSALAVDTNSPTNVTDSSATLQGSLTDMGGADSVDVSFEWGQAVGDTVTATSSQTLTATGGFSVDITGLDPETTYEFEAIAEASDGDFATSVLSQFTTASGTTNSAPVIDSFVVTTADKPNPHADISIDWAVADSDGNLQSVTIEILDGAVIRSTTSDVAGSTASGSDSVQIKRGGGASYDVRLTVTDTTGQSQTETRTVTAS